MRVNVNWNDLALRVASVVLALVLWVAVAGPKSAEIAVVAPVEFRNVPDGLELVGDFPRTIEVWLRGSPGIVHRLRPGEVYAAVDLEGAVPGPRTVHLSGREVRAPYGARIETLRPSFLSLALERTERKTVPVKPRLAGEPAPGHAVVGIVASPAEVAVSGPQSLLATLDALSTAPVAVAQAKMKLVREVSLDPAPAPLRLVDAPASVRVTVSVERREESRR
jgi:YbbR domain-containing protein